MAAGDSLSRRAEEDFVLTAVGDAVIMVPTVQDRDNPRFHGVLSALREGDAQVCNLEEIFPSDRAYPHAVAPNTYMAAPAEMLDELQSMGFSLFGMANNHSNDYGIQGLLDTIDVLNERRAVFAGIGPTLGKARAPAYLTTPRGRVGFLSCTATFLPEAMASNPRPDHRGRPGLNPVRFETTYYVDQSTYDTLKTLRHHKGVGPACVYCFDKNPEGTKPGEIGVGGRYYEVGETPGSQTHVDQSDVDEIVACVQDARARANYVVLSSHVHEFLPQDDGTMRYPEEFEREFAHAVIDAGVDVYVGHGPHVLQGIEIYRGRPILYSLNGIFFQNDLPLAQPVEFYLRQGVAPDAPPSEAFARRKSYADPEMYEGAIARVAFRHGRPSELRITPVVIRGKDTPLPNYGAPELADRDEAERILRRIRQMSEPWRTPIEIVDGIGIVGLDESPELSPRREMQTVVNG